MSFKNVPLRLLVRGVIAIGLTGVAGACATVPEGNSPVDNDNTSVLQSDRMSPMGETGYDKNEILRVTSQLRELEMKQIDPASKDRLAFERELNELFKQCGTLYGNANETDKQALTEAMQNLFEANPLASTIGFKFSQQGICGAVPQLPF